MTIEEILTIAIVGSTIDKMMLIFTVEMNQYPEVSQNISLTIGSCMYVLYGFFDNLSLELYLSFQESTFSLVSRKEKESNITLLRRINRATNLHSHLVGKFFIFILHKRQNRKENLETYPYYQ